MEIWVLR